jgi:hypothetical protein
VSSNQLLHRFFDLSHFACLAVRIKEIGNSQR